MNEQILNFLDTVRRFVAANPEAAAYVADYARAGLEEALATANTRAADMEVALVAAVSKRMKGADTIIRDKLKKWQGRTSCRWEWYTDNGDGK